MTEKPSSSGIDALLTTREVDKELNDLAQRVMGAGQPPIHNLPPSRQGLENAKKVIQGM
jgi:hypothetical protein